MNTARYCFFSLALFLFCKIGRIRIFHINVNNITLLYFAGILFVQKLKRKDEVSIYFSAYEIWLCRKINSLRSE